MVNPSFIKPTVDLHFAPTIKKRRCKDPRALLSTGEGKAERSEPKCHMHGLIATTRRVAIAEETMGKEGKKMDRNEEAPVPPSPTMTSLKLGQSAISCSANTCSGNNKSFTT